jgi:hypothetical protein
VSYSAHCRNPTQSCSQDCKTEEAKMLGEDAGCSRVDLGHPHPNMFFLLISLWGSEIKHNYWLRKHKIHVKNERVCLSSLNTDAFHICIQFHWRDNYIIFGAYKTNVNSQFDSGFEKKNSPKTEEAVASPASYVATALPPLHPQW